MIYKKKTITFFQNNNFNKKQYVYSEQISPMKNSKVYKECTKKLQKKYN